MTLADEVIRLIYQVDGHECSIYLSEALGNLLDDTQSYIPRRQVVAESSPEIFWEDADEEE